MTILVAAAQREELAPLARRLIGRPAPGVGESLTADFGATPVVLLNAGEGRATSSRSLAAAVAAVGSDLKLVLGIGLAGGLSPDLTTGALVVGERVLDTGDGWLRDVPASRWQERALAAADTSGGSIVSTAEIATGPATKAALARCVPAPAVVDLESAAWAKVAAGAGVAFVVARVVSDSCDEELPLDFEAFRDRAGAVDRGRVLRAALRRPGVWPGLWRLRGRLHRGAEALAELTLDVIAA